MCIHQLALVPGCCRFWRRYVGRVVGEGEAVLGKVGREHHHGGDITTRVVVFISRLDRCVSGSVRSLITSRCIFHKHK